MREILKRFGIQAGPPSVNESYLEVIDVVASLRATHSHVGVSIVGDDENYVSSVQAFSARHGVMVIDLPTPSVPLWMLNPGHPITLSTSTHGRDIYLKTRFQEFMTPNMDYGIQLEIPGAISSTQPRHAFRVMLDGIRNRVSVSLTDAEANVVFGVARNLSRAGLGMRTQAPLPAHFGERDKLVDCRINLQGGGEIACKVEICNVQSQTRDDGGAYLGGRMVEISRRDSSLLNNFVRQLQLQNFEAYA